MTTFAVKIIGFVLPTFLFVVPLKADTVTEALPRCIEIAEAVSQFGLAFQSAMDEIGETTSSRDIATLFSSAIFVEGYVDRLMPLLEEEASHDRLIDELSTIEMKRSTFEEFTADLIEELLVGGDEYSDKSQFISQCAQGAFNLSELGDEVEPSPEMLSSMGAATNTSDGLVTAETRPKARPDAVLDALLAPVATGPPMTGAEMAEFRNQIMSCWIVGALPAESPVRLTVRFSLLPDGRVDGDVRMISASGGDEGSIAVAFRAARSAILRCQSRGYTLPTDKYEQWKEIELVFEPSNMWLR